MFRTVRPLFSVLAFGGLLGLAGSAWMPDQSLAQPAVPASAVRAINLARATGINQNGGLSVYRPAQCMFQTANPANPCLISTPGDGGNARDNRDNPNSPANAYVFRFQGGPPGWQQTNQPPSVETEVSISADGRSVLQINYNGSPR